MSTPSQLDPIERHVVSRLNLTYLCSKLRGEPWLWARNLIRTLAPSETDLNKRTPREERWCGVELSNSPEIGRTRAKLEPVFDEIKDSLLEETKNPAKGAVTSVLFLVPKTPELSRIVLDGRALNGLCTKPPHLEFISISDIFRVVQFFPRPYIGTGDFRHWFYQIPLDPLLQHLFSLECNGRFFHQRAWAMGFSWSPFVAQGISMALAKWGIEEEPGEGEEKWFAIPSAESEDTPPPFWFVSDRNVTLASELRRDNVVGFISFWYDNLLVIAKSARARERLLRNTDRQAQSINALWKPKKEANVGPTHKDDFTRSTNGAAFMGIEFVNTRKGWTWNHLQSNRDEWQSTSSKGETSWRAAAKLTGILTWDWTVSGESRQSFEEVLEVTREIGRHAEGNWDSTAPDRHDQGVTAHQWRMLKGRLGKICIAPFRQWPRLDRAVFENTRLLASDAMNERGVGLDLHTGKILVRLSFEDFSKERHINWKETATALATIRAAARETKARTRFLIAVDNTTAKAVINAGYVPWDGDLDREIADMKRELWLEGSLLEAVYIPGEDQPADEPSRNLATIEAKITACGNALMRRETPWWQTIEL